jgi:CelD/BcsL family acetyltransferase involved in cellulose biosynthesis
MFTSSAEPVLQSCTAGEWLAFIQTQPQANIFHHPAWLGLLCQSYRFEPRYLALRDAQGQVCAGLPLAQVGGLAGKKRLVALPFSDHCAPLAAGPAARQAFFQALLAGLERLPGRSLELRWSVPPDSRLAVRTPYVLSELRLAQDPQEISARLNRKDFRNVAVSRSRGVSTSLGSSPEDLQAFYRLHLHNRRRHGVPVQPWKFFRGLSETLLQKGYGFIINAAKDGETVATSLFLAWNETLIEKYSATSAEGRQLLAIDPIIWEAICWGCEHGLRVFDLGRSDLDNSGLRGFKKRWGAQEMPLSYTYYPAANQKVEGQSRWMALAQSAIQRAPAWVCRLTGELFFRYFA